MTWLLFLDESGHDHKRMPFEVRGGVALHVSRLWGFIQAWRRLEEDCFGATLATYGKEAKGEKLLDRDRFKWAAQAPLMEANQRRKLARGFLELGRIKAKPMRDHFTAYGQASLDMARGALDLLHDYDARLFAALIPRGAQPPRDFTREDYLRKDQVFLFERFFYSLEAQKTHGLIVMDQTDKVQDRRFVERMIQYFRRTVTGRNRTTWITPAPIFVDSDMSHAVQAADLCLYCINWGFRLPAWQPFGADYEVRQEIVERFTPALRRLQWHGDGYRDGNVFHTYGITLVKHPYEARR